MATFPRDSKYCDIVESYLQNRLPQEGFHPSFQHLSEQPETDARRPLRAYSQTDPDLPVLLVPKDEKSEVSDENGPDVSIEELYEDANEETQHFIEATLEYEKSAVAADPKYKAMIDWSHAHTWEEVIEEVDKAAQSYNDTSNVWGKIRKAFRSVGGNKEVFVAWLDLLPTQSQYCSIVCGGLKLIFGAASRLKTLGEEACSALTQIPSSLARTGKILKIFSASTELHKCSSALYVSILATLEHILRYYKGNSAKRLVKATFKQGEYESKLSEKIKVMDTHSQTFKDLATQCAYQTQASTLGEVRSLKLQAKARDRRVMQYITHSRSEATLQQWKTTNVVKAESANSQKSIQGLKTEVTQLRNDQRNLQKLLKSRSDRTAELTKALKDFYRSNGRIDPRTNDFRYRSYAENDSTVAISSLARERLSVTEKVLAVLEFEIELLPDAVDSNQRYVWTLPLSAQDRAVALMESERLHTWLTSAQPSALFVNGNYEASARQSPISYVCSKLLDSICPGTAGMRPKYPSILAHAFFCGQHADTEDLATGPLSLMRSLVSQLVINYNAFDISTLKWLLEIDSLDVGELCIAFSDLIRQLPRRYLVFCIIDGITLYEESLDQCEAATEAIKALLEVMEDCKDKGCLFKLLVTGPGVSRVLHQEFEDAETIWMPAKVDAHGGLTPAKWEASAEVYVNEWLPQQAVLPTAYS